MLRVRSSFRKALGYISRGSKPAGVKGFTPSAVWGYILRIETVRCPLSLGLEESPAFVYFLFLFSACLQDPSVTFLWSEGQMKRPETHNKTDYNFIRNHLLLFANLNLNAW